MLYLVQKPDMKILTHPYTPLMEENGFRQLGDFVPISSTKKSDLIPAKEVQNLIHPAPPARFKPPRAGQMVRVIPKKFQETKPWPLNTGNASNRDNLYMGESTLSGSYSFYTNPVISPPKNADTFYTNNELGSWLSKAGRSVSKTVKKAVSKPGRAVVTLASKVALGGATLITETGILGKSAKKAGKKAETIAAGAIGGGAAGFVTSGFNPAGAVAGAVAGGAKGVAEATKTSKSGDSAKALYQGAAYGAGTGVALRAVNAGISSYETAQHAKSAAEAAKVGYGAASSTAMAAGGYVPPSAVLTSSGYLATASKIGGSVLKYGATALGLQYLMGGKPPILPGEGGEMAPSDSNVTVNLPETGAGIPSGGNVINVTTGGGGEGSGGGGLPLDETLSASPSGIFSKSLPYLAGGALLLFFTLRKK